MYHCGLCLQVFQTWHLICAESAMNDPDEIGLSAVGLKNLKMSHWGFWEKCLTEVSEY